MNDEFDKALALDIEDIRAPLEDRIEALEAKVAKLQAVVEAAKQLIDWTFCDCAYLEDVRDEIVQALDALKEDE